MKSPRTLLACALLIIALAAVQLSLNVVGRVGDGQIVPVARLLSEGASFDRGDAHEGQQFFTEDMPGWRCDKMGNRECAPAQDGDHELSGAFPGADDPRPLKMAGVEIHKKECPKGADARVKLMQRSAIYGHCAVKKTDDDSGPKGPKEPSTSRGKK